MVPRPRAEPHVSESCASPNTREGRLDKPIDEQRKDECKKTQASNMLHWLQLPLEYSLPLLIFLDMMAVSLVVPLLSQYYTLAGITSPSQRELLSSLFSSSQIGGGLLMSFLTDALHVQQRTLLLIAFGGSALSYALVATGELSAILSSRIIVGLVKHSMTVSTTLLSKYPAHVLGRLTAASTVAWIIGPSVGAWCFHQHEKAPLLLACGLFVLNFGATVWLIPSESISTCRQRKKVPMMQKLKACATSSSLAAVILIRLLVTWVVKATNYTQLVNFYESMYGIETYQRGYISSYQQLLRFGVQLFLVSTVLRWTGGERWSLCLFSGLLALTAFLESFQSFTIFLALVCPLSSLCLSMLNLSLQSLVTSIAPQNSVFSVLAALDMLQNAVSVTVPFYRTMLLRQLSMDSNNEPDPVAWIRASMWHWFVAAAVTTSLSVFIKFGRSVSAEEKQR